MKITRLQLKSLIKEEISLLEANDFDSAGWPNPGTSADIDKGPPKFIRTRDRGTIKVYPGDTGYDDHSETRAEEAGMARHHSENEDEIMNSRALALAQKIAHLFPQAGLGSVSEEELPILARHLLAVKAELDPNKHWNK
jgi:hypothetical protein